MKSPAGSVHAPAINIAPCTKKALTFFKIRAFKRLIQGLSAGKELDFFAGCVKTHSFLFLSITQGYLIFG